MTTYNEAIDAILGTLKLAWEANAPAVNGSVLPVFVTEMTEGDLKPHPKNGTLAWMRAVVRHNDANKATLANAASVARYRRYGKVTVQIYVPGPFASSWGRCQDLAEVAAKGYEGKRSLGGRVVFTHVQVIDQPKEGAWVRKDVLAFFYWDDVR